MRHYRRHVAEDQGREEVLWEDLYGGIWQVYKFAPWHTKLCSKWWWQCLKLCHPTVEDWMLVYGYMEFADAIKEGDRQRVLRCWQYFILVFRASTSSTMLASLSISSISIFLHYPLGCLISYLEKIRQCAWSIWPKCPIIFAYAKMPWGILGSNETQVASVSRIRRSIGVLYPLLENFDCEQSVQKSSSK